MKNFGSGIATCGGIGLAPFGPGTWASAIALVFWWGLYHHLGMSLYELILVNVVLLVLGVLSVRALSPAEFKKDDSRIVIDEWVGVGIAAFFSNFSVGQLILAFVLFRFFDISKVLGVRYFDRRYWGGWGVMLDDVAAGFYAGFLVWGWNVFIGS